MTYADATLRNLKSALEAQVVITLASDAVLLPRELEPVKLLSREGKHDNHQVAGLFAEPSDRNQRTF